MDLCKISPPLHVFRNGEHIDTLFVEEVSERDQVEYNGEKHVVFYGEKSGFYMEIGSSDDRESEEYWKNKEIEIYSMLLTGPLSEVAPKFQALAAKYIQLEKENYEYRKRFGDL